MPYSNYTNLAVKRDAGIATVSINRPDALNAINAGLHHELSTIFHELADDPDVSVIVLTGEGRAFCAGGDLQWVNSQLDEHPPFLTSLREGRKIVMGILDCPKPIICRINGDAIGLGATIALLSDIIIAVDTARIADPHVRIGLVAGDGGALIWPQLVGYAKAKEFLLTGNSLDATEAARIGLINYAVSAADLDATVGRFASQLARGAQSAIRYTKMCTNIPLRQMVASVLDNSLACEGLSIIQNAELREGVSAFLEGRKPRYVTR
ncbi:enoyl-CoA hydratase-related protein [Burkholderia sp. Ac-20353]|uniref:enoyl-CoA hydratase/isomerase family protein n=1 Tax=Burkholderia sp. Ac-20353 TaxID=2703894 RepID=UPI00197BC17E|nr:enoyl-CoA hydratase-related protein [Burkholderia sp. Ac-20353]MBN3788505.1 enoyl-CoA hydratase/isomerase family protein [Burkholderia sp. Ac-20353]